MSVFNLSYRQINVVLFAFCCAAMAFALLFLQNYLKLDPCPLCIFQRIGVMIMGAFSLLAAIINTQKKALRWLLWIGGFLGIAWSLGTAAWHVYLQHLPPSEVPSCGPGLNYWVETLPLKEVFVQVFTSSGECAAIDWTLFGFSIPEQSLALFSLLMLIHLILAYRIIKKQA